MKICRIVKHFPPFIGGMEFHARDLSIAQAAHCHTVDALILHGSTDTDSANFRIEKVSCSFLCRYFRKDSLISLVFILSCLPALIRSHRSKKIDILHVHGDIVEAWVSKLFAKIIGNPPVILTLHAGLNAQSIYRFLGSRIFRSIDALICVSDDIRQELLGLGVDDNKITVLHSGINYAFFDTPRRCESLEGTLRRETCNRNEVVLVSIGRLHPMKGYEYLIEAVCSQLPEMAIRLLIIGSGPEEEKLRKLAAACVGRIEFLGKRDKNEVNAVLHQADIFVLPSVTLEGQREGTPTAVLEAMAAGMPIIATDVGGSKKIVEQGVNGCIVRERDSAVLAEAISSLAADAELRKEMGLRNNEKARQFDWSHIVNKVEKVYAYARQHRS